MTLASAPCASSCLMILGIPLAHASYKMDAPSLAWENTLAPRAERQAVYLSPLSTCLSLSLSVCLPVSPLYLSVCLSVYLTYLSFCLRLSACLTCLSVYLSTCLCVCLSPLSTCLSVCLSPLSTCLSVCLSVCLPVYPRQADTQTVCVSSCLTFLQQGAD